MHKQINYTKVRNFQGRNGTSKQAGLSMYFVKPPHVNNTNNFIVLVPITTKGINGNCSIEIPFENCGELATVLSSIAVESSVKPKRRYFAMRIEEKNGEREYTIPYLTSESSRCKKTAEEIAEKVAKTWYADRDRGMMGDWFSFSGGEVATRVYDVHEISESDYLIMSKYI